jgi:hypothetical protein
MRSASLKLVFQAVRRACASAPDGNTGQPRKSIHRKDCLVCEQRQVPPSVVSVIILEPVGCDPMRTRNLHKLFLVHSSLLADASNAFSFNTNYVASEQLRHLAPPVERAASPGVQQLVGERRH